MSQGQGYSQRRLRRHLFLSSREIAGMLVSPVERTYLLLVGDSRLAAKEPQIVAATGIQWSGTIAWASQSLLNSAGVHTSGAVGASGNSAPTSPLIGGAETWFPNGDIEVQFLGGTTLTTALNTRMVSCGFVAATFPTVKAACVGYTSRVRTVAHRRTGAPSSRPGVRVIANFTGGAGFTSPNCVGDTVTDFTGSGYVGLHATVPSSHDWTTYPNINQDLTTAPNVATTNGEIFAYHQLWLEAQRAGVVCLSLAVGGAAIGRWLDAAVTPLTIWSGLLPTMTEMQPTVVWIDLGTNNPANNTQAQHEAYLEELIIRIRAGLPYCPILLTTAYPTSTDGATTYYRDAARMVATRVRGVLLVDTFPMLSYADAVTASYMADVTHYNAAGNLAYFQRIANAIVSAAA